MAQSRFSAVLKRVRLWIVGKSESERRGPLGHQFSADAAPAGVLGHQFGFGTSASAPIGHQANVSGIKVTSVLGQEFNVSHIDTSATLGHQYNTNEVNKEAIVAHRFGVAFATSGVLGHEFQSLVAAASGVSHEFEIPHINITDALGHQFNVEYIDSDWAIAHHFGVTTVGSGVLSHKVSVVLAAASGLNHQFNVDAINTSGSLSNEFNVDVINAESILAQQFAVLDTTSGVLGHEFLSLRTGQEELGHQLYVNAINSSNSVAHKFNVTDITRGAFVAHKFSVQQDSDSSVGHEYSVEKTTTGAIAHSVNVDRVDGYTSIEHQFNVPVIDAAATLGHSFGFELDSLSVVGHKFGFEVFGSGVLGHRFNVYGVVTGSDLSHEVDVFEIRDKTRVLGHQFLITDEDTKSLAHVFRMAFDDLAELGHEFNVISITANQVVGHQFNNSGSKSLLGHSFSANGVATVHAPLSHEYNVEFILPSWRVGHQFNISIQLELPSSTISGDFRHIPEEDISYPFDIISEQVEKIEHVSYASPHNIATSSGTWYGINPSAVISEKQSGLSEADYLLGSFLFENEPENLETYELHLTSGQLTTWPEYESDTVFEFQAWSSPVITEGEGAWWNLNDFPIRLLGYSVEQAPNPFPLFFGRQISISGVLREFVGTFSTGDYPEGMDSFDPFGRVSVTDIEEVQDPFVFNSYTITGEHNLILERYFLISGIYISQPNGEPGTNLRPRGTVVRLGFTSEESNFQPEELIWELGINQLPGVYTYWQETDQWILAGRYRDFDVPELAAGSNVCGQITVRSPARVTEYTGNIPPEIVQQTIDDAVRAYGGGTFVWPDINHEEYILQLCVEIEQLQRRTRIPTGITIRYEGVNSKGKIVKFTRNTSYITATYIEVPSNVVHDDRINTLVVNQNNPTLHTLASNRISSDSITVYRKEGENSQGKIIIIDEEVG